MREIRTSGLMSGDGKRGNAPPRPSSTLQINGRKRHLLVDTIGLMVAAIVHRADIQDRDGGVLLMATLFGLYPFLLKLYADAGYQGG
jgi:putative transposase